MHDIPLIGVFEQNNRLFLFECLAGELEQEPSLWCYVPITAEDRAYLEEVTGDAFDERLGEFDERVTHYASALEDLGILHWVDVSDVPEDRDPVDWLRHVLKRFADNVKSDAENLVLAHD